MKFLGFFTSLINIGLSLSELQEGISDFFNTVIDTLKTLLLIVPAALYSVIVWLSGAISALVYSVLNWSYDVFNLLATMNMSSLSNYISGIVTRLNAVIIVIVVYNFATTIISYMSKPEKAKEKGVTFLKNIFVTAALLISYNLIFGLLNEVSLLVLGNRTKYDFPILSQVMTIDSESDQGMISRFVFGTKENDSVGSIISCGISDDYVTLVDEHGASVECTGDYAQFASFPNAFYRAFYDLSIGLNVSIEHSAIEIPHPVYAIQWYNIIGIIIGGLMAYFLIKACIDLGVRMFKLMILQICAPIPIVSILTDGFESKESRFRKYCSTYLAVYIEVFVRLFVLFLVCAFVINFIDIVGSFFPAMDTEGTDILTRLVLIGICSVSAFFFLNYAPAFIDSALGTNMASSMGAIGDGLIGGGIAGFSAVKNAWANNKFKKDENGEDTDELNSKASRLWNTARAGLRGVGAGYQNAAGTQNKGNSISSKLASYSKLAENSYQTGINSSDEVLFGGLERQAAWEKMENSISDKSEKLAKLKKLRGGTKDENGNSVTRLDEIDVATEKMDELQKLADKDIEGLQVEMNAKVDAKANLNQSKVQLEGNIAAAEKDVKLAQATLDTNAEVKANIDKQQAAVDKATHVTATRDDAISKANATYEQEKATIENNPISGETDVQTKAIKERRIKAAEAKRDSAISEAEKVYSDEMTEVTKEYKEAGGTAVDSNGRLLLGQAVEIIKTTRQDILKSDKDAEISKATNTEILKKANEELKKTNEDLDKTNQEIASYESQIKAKTKEKENITVEIYDYGDEIYNSEIDNDDPSLKSSKINVDRAVDEQGNYVMKRVTKKDLEVGKARFKKFASDLENEVKQEEDARKKRLSDSGQKLREADTKRYSNTGKK